jgi:hypothetical protein
MTCCEEAINVNSTEFSEYRGSELSTQVQAILPKHQRLLRKALGPSTDGIKMPIEFNLDAEITDLRQQPFPLSRRDQDGMDEI